MIPEIPRISKRAFIRLLGLSAAAALAPGLLCPDPSSAQENPDYQNTAAPAQSYKPRKTIYNILGMHDAPRIGGSVDLQTMKTHLKGLGVKFITGHLPSPEWYEIVKSIGATPIVRLNLADNRFDEAVINTQLASVPRETLVVPFNEVNLSGEVGWVPMFPEEAAENDYRAFSIIAEHGCIPMLTPTSPGGILEKKDGTPVVDKNGQGYDEDRYFYMYMQRHGSLNTFRHFPQAVIAMHAYDFKYYKPDFPTTWERLRKLNDTSIKPIAGNIPIHITEGGFFLADVDRDKIDSQEIGTDIEKFLDLDLNEVLGPDLADQIKSYGWWVYANYAQLLPTDPSSPRFEKNALFESAGGQSKTNGMYDGFARYHQIHG